MATDGLVVGVEYGDDVVRGPLEALLNGGSVAKSRVVLRRCLRGDE